MQLSIRDAKARLSEAVSTMESGERVVLTRNGKPVAELVRPNDKEGALNFEAADAYLLSVGWENTGELWPPHFDDPAFSRYVLGLED